MKNDINIRPATVEDIDLFFKDKSLPYTVRAWVAEYHGEPSAIAGVFVQGKIAVAFSEVIKKDVPKKAVWRGAVMLMEKIRSIGLPLQAQTECSGKFLSKLGFIQANKEGTMYVCS